MENYIKLAVQETDIDSDLIKDGNYRNMVNTYIKESRQQVLKNDGITAETGNAQIELTTMAAMPSRENMSMDQAALFDLIRLVFTRTAFPWLVTSRMKHAETLMKKLYVLYVSDRAREDLLATQSSWQVRTFLQSLLDGWMAQKGLGPWLWLDGVNQQPMRNINVNPALDDLEGPLKIGKDETLGNQNARLQSYLELRADNHRKMQRIVQLTLSEGLGLGFGKEAIPEVLASLKDFLKVRKHTLSEHRF